MGNKITKPIPSGKPSIAISDLDKRIKQLKEERIPGETELSYEYKILNSRCKELFGKEKSKYSKINGEKNRYDDVHAYDRTRVKLGKNKNNNYINANWIKPHGCEISYIAAQGPKGTTAVDFWKMIWQEKVEIVIMLTKLEEKDKEKCFRYWPKTDGDNLDFKEFDIILEKTENLASKERLIQRKMKIKEKNSNEERYIVQFHYLEWPDHGAPPNTRIFRKLIHCVDEIRSDKPILVHCSAGIGRTGTFCTVHVVLESIKFQKKKGIQNPEINIFDVVTDLRFDRYGMVQTQIQYEFCYLAVLDEIRSWENKKLNESSEEQVDNLWNTRGKKNGLDSYIKKPVKDNKIDKNKKKDDKDSSNYTSSSDD